jgi:hypothetical protein
MTWTNLSEDIAAEFLADSTEIDELSLSQAATLYEFDPAGFGVWSKRDRKSYFASYRKRNRDVIIARARNWKRRRDWLIRFSKIVRGE